MNIIGNQVYMGPKGTPVAKTLGTGKAPVLTAIPAFTQASVAESTGPLESILSTALNELMDRRIPTTVPEMTPKRIAELAALIRPGDVLVSTNFSYPVLADLEYLAVGSHYTHCAFVGGDGGVYEASDYGVVKTTLEKYMQGRKKFAIARFERSAEDLKASTEYCEAQVGKAYDKRFDYRSDETHYCSELVARALGVGENPIKSPLVSVLGREAVAPDVFLNMPGVKVVYDGESHYWKNKLHYWPLAASAAAFSVLGGLVGGLPGAALGAGAGLLGSILVGNQIQTGHFFAGN